MKWKFFWFWRSSPGFGLMLLDFENDLIVYLTIYKIQLDIQIEY